MSLFRDLKRVFGVRRHFISVLEKSGYWIQERRNLPIGADFAEDVLCKLKISPLTIFDIGANYGQTASYFSEIFPDAKIFSFEPITSSYERLLINTQGLHNVTCFQTAFGQKEGVVEVSLYDDDRSHLNSLKAEHSNLSLTAKKEKVAVTTVDLFVESHNIDEIDVLKIDTEGYEVEVLNGALKTIEQGRVKLVLSEVSLAPSNQRNTALTDLLKCLEPFNYSLIGLYDTDISFLKDGLPYGNALFLKSQIDDRASNHKT